MLSSAWFLTRRRDCLHQTPIEAQPSPGRRCGAAAPRPRNISVPSCRLTQGAGSRFIDRVQLCGELGGGAEQSSSVARDPYVFKTATSNSNAPLDTRRRACGACGRCPKGDRPRSCGKRGSRAFHSSGRIHRPRAGGAEFHVLAKSGAREGVQSSRRAARLCAYGPRTRSEAHGSARSRGPCWLGPCGSS
jgi:hypothetical protein